MPYDFTPAEIAMRASRVGVVIRRFGYCFADMPNRETPHAFSAWYVEYYDPDKYQFSVLDDMARVTGGPWLPAQNYGDEWCFADEMGTVHPKLRDAIWKFTNR
jgi:hypothetical protein